MTPKQNMREAKKRLAEYDRVHGRWNRDRHRYERKRKR